MKMKKMGRLNFEIPVVGQGTWMMEGDGEAAPKALRRGIELGLTHVDTAEMYGSGQVETLVGKALSGVRDRVFLASKVLPSNASYEGTIAACEQSLARLGTDRLDLYLLHWPSSFPFEETYRAFETLKKEGKILACGVSNFDVAELEEAYQVAGKGNLACNQVLYHLLERTIENQIIPWCRRHEISVVAYSPFGQSRFPEPRDPGGRELSDIARAHGKTTRQVALQFLVQQSDVFVIPKSSNLLHVEENANALEFKLSTGEVEQLGRAFPKGLEDTLPVL